MAEQMPLPTCQVPNSNIKLIGSSAVFTLVPSTGGIVNTPNTVLLQPFCSVLLILFIFFLCCPLLLSFPQVSWITPLTSCPMWFVCACCVDRCAAAIIRQQHEAAFPHSLTIPPQSTLHTCTTQLCVPLSPYSGPQISKPSSLKLHELPFLSPLLIFVPFFPMRITWKNPSPSRRLLSPRLPLLKMLSASLSPAAQAKRSQRWHKREAATAAENLREVPQQASDGEDLQAAVRFHRAQDQVSVRRINHLLLLVQNHQQLIVKVNSRTECVRAWPLLH